MEKEIKISSGYLCDEVTLKDFGPDTPRITSCDNGFVWPKVKMSNGKEVKIAFRCFTSEEKVSYYKATGKGAYAKEGGGSQKKSHMKEALTEIDTFVKTKLKGKDLEAFNAIMDRLMPKEESKAQKMVSKMSEEEKAELLKLLSGN